MGPEISVFFSLSDVLPWLKEIERREEGSDDMGAAEVAGAVVARSQLTGGGGAAGRWLEVVVRPYTGKPRGEEKGRRPLPP